MGNLLKELWYGNVSPIDTSGNTKEIKEIFQLLAKNGVKVEEFLNKEGKEWFDKYRECSAEYESLVSEAAFECGFCLGMRFLAEAFLGAERYRSV